MRDIVFVSHANPDDNEFALWLTLRLASEGYATWCDLTKLLGGEDFWSDIEATLRERTAKFLYVLSEASNHRMGTLQELAVAQAVAKAHGLRDFVIPLKIDRLAHSETNIRVHPLNAIRFSSGWATGLGRLLEKFDEDAVPKNPAFSPSAVGNWWRSFRGIGHGVVDRPEEYLTNWFPIEQLPDSLYAHRLIRYGGGPTELVGTPPYPVVKHGSYAVSFARADDLSGMIVPPDQLVGSETVPLADFLNGSLHPTDGIRIERREARNLFTRLLRQAWELEIDRRRLPSHELSGGAKFWYFTQGMTDDHDRVYFAGTDGRHSYRQVVGRSTRSAGPGTEPTTRYWHFGLQLKALTYPVRAYAAKPHVLFSSDGRTIWESDRRLHRARRSECKNWWNAEWRDRILASMSWLADGQPVVELPLGSDQRLTASRLPLVASSPVSYSDPCADEAPVDVDSDADWDDDEDDEDEDP